MCILIQKPAEVRFTKEHFMDFYETNPDGFGAMYCENGKIELLRIRGNVNYIWKKYSELCADKECSIHFRMRTHGHIDNANIHPYHVVDQVFLMHNGVLSHGNAKDPSKSDTFHYIKDVLRPILTEYPDLWKSETFIKILGESIGDCNKFIMMDNSGNRSIVNEDTGVYWEVEPGQPKVWLSNTYAWPVGKYIPAYRSNVNHFTNFSDFLRTSNNYLLPSSHDYTSRKMSRRAHRLLNGEIDI